MSSELTPAQQRALLFSPLSFFRGHEIEIANAVLDDLTKSKNNGSLQCFGDEIRLWFKKLEWDTNYFHCPTYRLDFVEWDDHVEHPELPIAETLLSLQAELNQRHQNYYLFSEAPSEDTVLLQAFGLAGMRLIETRLTYFHDQLKSIEIEKSYPVRVATEADIHHLRSVAMQARNDFDRFHADPFFSTETADEFIAEYVEQCVKGLTDVVLVPAVDSAPPGAFVCGSAGVDILGEVSVGRLVLVAVSEPRRGCYRWLNQSLMLWMREQGMSCIVNTTQSTNRAVIHVCETLGYQYGRSTHLFANHQKIIS